MERSKKRVLHVVLLVMMMGLGLVSWAAEAQENNILEALKVSDSPKLDGMADAQWEKAKPLAIKVIDGANLPGGETDVTLRAVYTKDMVYFLTQCKDATQSFRRSPWQKQTDGAWKKLKDPNDKGGDNNLYYEDKFGWAWNISSPDFEKQGCAIACHTGEGKPYGNKYMEKSGERIDMWHLKSVRTGSLG